MENNQDTQMTNTEALAVDCTSVFTTTRVFLTRDELLSWVRNIGKYVGCVVVISRSDNGRSSKKTFVMFACERGGKYKPYKSENVRATDTRKCECLFRLKGSSVKSSGGWVLKVMCGTHNHALPKNFEGHPYVGRLSSNEMSMLSDMTKNMVKPHSALLSLQQNNPESHTTIRQIYNARQKIRSTLRQARTELQYLMNLMHRDHYVHWHRRAGDSDVIRDIFWTHPEAITLANTFNIVLLIDSTYKTNRYRMLLVEVVCVTSTEMTFSVAFAYVESEKLDNFVWVLEKLRDLFRRDDALPQVIVTDRDLALMNAVSNVFPMSYNLLCQFHIRKNMRGKCKTHVYPEDKLQEVMTAFDSVANSSTPDEYEKRLAHFEDVSAPFANFVDYLKNTWLNPHKENFVSAWIDRVMHIGNTTTNRVLEKLRGLFRRDDALPQVIVTDRDLALMNAVSNVFPKSYNLLCQFHIRKNMRGRCKTHVYPEDKLQEVMTAFDSVANSSTSDEYEKRLAHFEDVSAPFANFVDYLKNTWLNPHKENFVSAWIDRVMHIGNTTTNRVESAHWRLKRLLQDSRGDLCNCWDAMNNMIKLQHTEIKSSFEHSISRQQHSYNLPVCKLLNGFVSRDALDFISHELQRVNTVGIHSDACGCVLRYTHNLPCACELARYTSNYIPIPLDVIHVHWRRLSFNNEYDTGDNSDSKLSVQVELEALARRFKELDIARKLVLKAKLRELAFPDMTSMCPPPAKVNTKGAPQKGKGFKLDISTRREPSYWERIDDLYGSQHDSTSAPQSCRMSTPTSSRLSQPPLLETPDPPLPETQALLPSEESTPPQPKKAAAPPNKKSAHPPPMRSFPSASKMPVRRPSMKVIPLIEQFPSEIHSYIENKVNVESDGNCGYRSIAALLGMGEESWPIIHQDLITELTHNHDLYVKPLGGINEVAKLKRSLLLPCGEVRYESWMTIPDAGYVVTTRYNVVLACISLQGSYTIFPLQRAPLPDRTSHRVISIGYIDRLKHIVPIYLKDGSPIPPSDRMWQLCRSVEASGWETPYFSRMQH